MFEGFRLYVNPNCNKDILNMDREGLVKDISKAIGEKDQKNKYKKERIKRYKKLSLKEEYGKKELKDYDIYKWMDQIVNENIKFFRLRSKSEWLRLVKILIFNVISFFKNSYSWKDISSYKDTNWFKFQEAVKVHQEETTDVLSPTFGKLELENW